MNDYSPLDTMPLPVKLRISDYLGLDEMGAFQQYAKTELIEGELFYVNSQHRPHAYAKNEIAYRLRRALEEASVDLYVMAEASIEIPDHSVPEPDIVLTSEPRGAGLIPLASVALVVEVADTTVESDLTRMAGLYAQAGIAEYWVVDIPARQVHQLWSPRADGYGERRLRAFGERLDAISLTLAIDIPD